MGLWLSFAGIVTVELTSADIPGLLLAISNMGVTLQNITHTDMLSVKADILRKDYGRLNRLISKKGGTLKLLARKGVYWRGKRLLARPVLVVGIGLLLLLSWFIPTRVFFITVAGNEQIPVKLILEKAQQCGIQFGASRRAVRSEKMKNSLLEAIPQLQWAGITTCGCTATISVKERTQTKEVTTRPGISSIVAVRDGIIQSCTVIKGNPLCKPGQAVKAGEVLISGYTDCNLTIQGTRAEGEVFAQTEHELTVITPVDFVQKGEISTTTKKYGLIIGKKRINFYKDSGILGTTCDRMYKEYYFTLPGGFQLPIALFVEQRTEYDSKTLKAAAPDVQNTLERIGSDYLKDHMISGEILGSVSTMEDTDVVCKLVCTYTCVEMIGRVQSEEILYSYGKSD